MFDKLRLFRLKKGLGDDFAPILSILDNAREQVELNTGAVSIVGNCNGLRVKVGCDGVSVTGSLCKFYWGGSNIHTLDRPTTTEAMQMMEDYFHLSMTEAKVLGLEFGTNFLMTRPVAEYLQMLGRMQGRMHKMQLVDSVYYQNSCKNPTKVIALYDKMAEAKKKKMDIAPYLPDANLLRYEMRLNGKLPKQMKMPWVTASALTDKSNYAYLMKLYLDNYLSINKQQQIKYDYMEKIKNPTDAFNIFVARLMSYAPNVADEYLDELKREKVFDDAKNYTRLKNKIEKVCQNNDFTTNDDLIRELDDEVKTICSNF